MRARLTYLDNNLWLWANVNAQARWDALAARRHRRRLSGVFDDVECYCTFVGYPRSGHSVVGSVLDAHPNAVFSHRLDAIKYIAGGYPAPAVYYMILRNSQRFARSNRHLTAYSYGLPGQGAFEHLTLIGDQEGQHSARRLSRDPDLLRTFAGSARLRFVHVVRNPFDNVATIANRTGRSLASVIDDYAELCRGVMAVKETYGDELVLDVYHEDFVAAPDEEIRRVCMFLGLNVTPEWVSRCARIVYRQPNRSRETRAWASHEVAALGGWIDSVDYLSRYRTAAALPA
jgi:hypothetical protein